MLNTHGPSGLVDDEVNPTIPMGYDEDTDVSDVWEPDDYWEEDPDEIWDDEGYEVLPMRTPTPMDEDVLTSRRGHDYDGERDELYRDRLLAEGHVVCLERGGDWSLVMGHDVESL